MKPADLDQFFAELLGKPNCGEALSWLGGSTEDFPRTLGECETNRASMDLVEEVYSAGALEVVVVDITTYPDGSQNSGRLVVRLPDEQVHRTETLRWCNKQAQRLGLPAEDEFGQRYLLVMLD